MGHRGDSGEKQTKEDAVRVMAGLGQGAGLQAGRQGGQREEEMGEQWGLKNRTGPVRPSEAQPLKGGRNKAFCMNSCTSFFFFASRNVLLLLFLIVISPIQFFFSTVQHVHF